MSRAQPPAIAELLEVPLGALAPGVRCDPGVPCVVTRVAPEEDGGCVRARSIPDGFELRLPAAQLVSLVCGAPARLRRCA